MVFCSILFKSLLHKFRYSFSKSSIFSMSSKRNSYQKNQAKHMTNHQFAQKSKQSKKKQSSSTSPYKNLTQCPMCCRKLNGLTDTNRDIHVNLCLDLLFNAPAISITSTKLTQQTKSKTFRQKVPKSVAFMPTNRKKKNKAMQTKNIPLQKKNYAQFKMLDAQSNIIIDGFKNSHFAPIGAIFFLTHFHSDHYQGLTAKFNQGYIYCSEITARLVCSQIRVKSEYLRPLPMYARTYIEDSNPRTFVTLMDANHCPGAVMFLFEVHNDTNGQIMHHLHIGDARCEYEENSLFFEKNHRFLSPYFGKINKLFLDTTYCLTQKHLPRQSDAIQFIADKVDYYLKKTNCKDLVILIGTYSIGKERILRQVAQQSGQTIFVTKRKHALFEAVYDENDPLMKNVFVNDWTAANIQVCPMRDIHFSEMTKYKKTERTKVIGFRPTGWAEKSSKNSGNGGGKEEFVINPLYSNKTKVDHMVIYEVPYSEHSSFPELCKFVNDIKPKEIIPTVLCSKAKEQIDILNANKDKISFEYGELKEGDAKKQTTLESCGFLKI